MSALFKLLLLVFMFGSAWLGVRLSYYIPFRRRERAARAPLSVYLDGIAQLVASGEPNFHRFDTWESGSLGPRRSRTYRIALDPALWFFIGRDWNKNRWEYWARFFDPLKNDYAHFPSGVVLDFRSPWFEAKAEMLLRILAVHHRRMERSGNAAVKAAAEAPAFPDFSVTPATAVSLDAFRQRLLSLAQAA